MASTERYAVIWYDGAMEQHFVMGRDVGGELRVVTFATEQAARNAASVQRSQPGVVRVDALRYYGR